MLKISACILGMLCWLKINYDQPITCNFDIPLSFYNMNELNIIDAPESIEVQLSGKRTDLYTFDDQKYAIHIDSTNFIPGKQTIAITSEKLFLPDAITMVHYTPCKIEIS
jgi:YbbR domain-containing protein